MLLSDRFYQLSILSLSHAAGLYEPGYNSVPNILKKEEESFNFRYRIMVAKILERF
jgi:hypothetical protein